MSYVSKIGLSIRSKFRSGGPI